MLSVIFSLILCIIFGYCVKIKRIKCKIDFVISLFLCVSLSFSSFILLWAFGVAKSSVTETTYYNMGTVNLYALDKPDAFVEHCIYREVDVWYIAEQGHKIVTPTKSASSIPEFENVMKRIPVVSARYNFLYQSDSEGDTKIVVDPNLKQPFVELIERKFDITDKSYKHLWLWSFINLDSRSNCSAYSFNMCFHLNSIKQYVEVSEAQAKLNEGRPIL